MVNKVRYSYLPQQFADPEEIFQEIRKLLKTGDFTLGAQVAQFEKSFAELIGTKYAIGVGSGTDALKLSLKALNVGYGDEVITAANTFIATTGAINELGAKTVFVDATDYYTLDPKKLEAAITKKTKAIMPVHLTGEPADMAEIQRIAAKHDLPIVEDACQAILAAVDGKKAGHWGKAAGFSLHPLKNLNVWGDGGVIVTNDDEMNRKLRLLRNHGMRNRDEIEVFGFNSRLDTLQAIVGNWLIKDTESITRRRKENAGFYNEVLSTLKGKVRLPPRRKNADGVYHVFMFRVDADRRDHMVKYLISKGIDAKVHYPIPLFLQDGLKHLGYRKGDFPETELQAKEVISLPVDQHLSKEEMQYCMDQVCNYFKEN